MRPSRHMGVLRRRETTKWQRLLVRKMAGERRIQQTKTPTDEVVLQQGQGLPPLSSWAFFSTRSGSLLSPVLLCGAPERERMLAAAVRERLMADEAEWERRSGARFFLPTDEGRAGDRAMLSVLSDSVSELTELARPVEPSGDGRCMAVGDGAYGCEAKCVCGGTGLVLAGLGEPALPEANMVGEPAEAAEAAMLGMPCSERARRRGRLMSGDPGPPLPGVLLPELAPPEWCGMERCRAKWLRCGEPIGDDSALDSADSECWYCSRLSKPLLALAA